jgi:ribosomal protein S18 acetylase RimI-like enzyme
MLIRDYQSGDFPQVETLWKKTGIYRLDRGDTPEIIEMCNAMGGKFLLMEDPGQNLIFASSWLTFDGRRLHMHHFAVLPPYQNQGFGRDLAKESLSYAGQRGIPVKIEVHKDNPCALHLYQSLGFEPLQGFGVYIKYP